MESIMINIYSITTDTLKGILANCSMSLAINKSTIKKALASVTTAGDVLTITFKEALDAGDIATLSALVAAHDGVPCEEVNKIESHTIVTNGGMAKVDEGFKFTATAGQITEEIHKFTGDLYAKGGVIYTAENHIMDQVSMTIMDKDFIYAGILYPADYEGTPWINVYPNGMELHTYVNNYPMDKNGHLEIDNYTMTDLNMKDLYLKFKYSSSGATDVAVNVGIRGYQ